MNHNESVAWGGVGRDKDPYSDKQVLLFLTWDGMHKRVSDRIEWMIAHTTTDFSLENARRRHNSSRIIITSLHSNGLDIYCFRFNAW